MKKLLITALLALGACSEKIAQSFIIDTMGVVVSIDKRKESFTIHWDCTNPPFKRQPCARYSIHAIAEYEEVKLGDTFRISKR